MSIIGPDEFRQMYLSELSEIEFDRDCKDDLTNDSLIGKYCSLTCSLIEASGRFNLTSIKEPVEIIRKHILDSAVPFSRIFRDFSYPSDRNAEFLDVGTGAGFPLLPVAALAELKKYRLSFTGLDSTEKKIRYVSDTAVKASINVRCITGRAEEMARGESRGHYDIVTARAVASLPVLLEITAGMLSENGIIVALKGNADQEIKDSGNAVKILGLEHSGTVTYSYSGGENRTALIFRKIRECPDRYPRRYSEIKKKPL